MIQKLVKQSALNQVFVWDRMSQLAQQRFQAVPPEVLSTFQDVFACPPTKIADDNCHDLRRIETRAQDNQTVSPSRRWEFSNSEVETPSEPQLLQPKDFKLARTPSKASLPASKGALLSISTPLSPSSPLFPPWVSYGPQALP